MDTSGDIRRFQEAILIRSEADAVVARRDALFMRMAMSEGSKYKMAAEYALDQMNLITKDSTARLSAMLDQVESLMRDSA